MIVSSVHLWAHSCYFRSTNIVHCYSVTVDDLEALNISGNALVNAAYEATVTNEKVGRNLREFGYEAHFFEKMVNLAYFDPTVYSELMARSLALDIGHADDQRSTADDSDRKQDTRHSRSSRDHMGDSSTEQSRQTKQWRHPSIH